jgi:hypothetical protein
LSELRTVEAYEQQFPEGAVRAEAFKHALDIRKFEIDLYWKRTAYFWTLIAASFVGFFALHATAIERREEALLLVTSVGLCFSVGLYLVNRGSKYWQSNWERHVDLLENSMAGPLYKTTISPASYRMRRLFSAYPFSVSRVNQILSLFVATVWVVFFLQAIVAVCWLLPRHHLSAWALLLLALCCLMSLFVFGRTRNVQADRQVDMKSRNYGRSAPDKA